MNIIDYIKGKRKGKETQHIERSAMTDEFLNDALDGFDNVDGNHAQNIDVLCSQITKRAQQKSEHKTRRKFIFWSAAASFNAILTWTAAACVAVGVAGGIIYFAGKSENSGNKIAYADENSGDILKQARSSKKSVIEEEIMPVTVEQPKPNLEVKEQKLNLESAKIVKNNTKIDDIKFDKNADKMETKAIDEIDKPNVAPEEEVEENIPTVSIGESPKFQGKNALAFKNWVEENLKKSEQAKSCEQGSIVVYFVIDENGNVTDVNITKKLSPTCDSEVEYILHSSPKWTPGKQNGKPIKVEYILPIKFL